MELVGSRTLRFACAGAPAPAALRRGRAGRRVLPDPFLPDIS